jgi:hypothetical protein
LERRQFIQRLSVSVAVLALPGWMQACTSRREYGADPTAGPSDGVPGSAHEALSRARDLGRPLLVIVVPDDLSSRNDRGDLWGAYLNHVDDEALVDLALCEVWCARPSEIRDELAPRLVVDPETVAVLVETDDRPAQLIREKPLRDPQPAGRRFGDEERIRASMGRLRDSLRAAIAPDSATLDRRVEDNRRSLVDEQLLDDHTMPSKELAQRAPAWVRRRAEHGTPAQRTEWMMLLHQQVVERLRKAPPPPAYWGRTAGCGTTIEGKPERDPAFDCGMGFTPEISSRFLVFYLEPD